MGLGNHKRKMSISLSITLIFPHTMANLVQTQDGERKSTTADDMLLSRMPQASEITFDKAKIFFPLFNFKHSSEFPEISPDLYLCFYLLQRKTALQALLWLNGITAGPKDADNCWLLKIDS